MVMKFDLTAIFRPCQGTDVRWTKGMMMTRGAFSAALLEL